MSLILLSLVENILNNSAACRLGIMHMFGGFTSAFFKRYHELVPKIQPVEDYGQRIQLYELYHHLNHTLLFEVSFAAAPRPNELLSPGRTASRGRTGLGPLVS